MDEGWDVGVGSGDLGMGTIAGVRDDEGDLGFVGEDVRAICGWAMMGDVERTMGHYRGPCGQWVEEVNHAPKGSVSLMISISLSGISIGLEILKIRVSKRSMDLNQVAGALTLWALGDSLWAIMRGKISPLAISNRTNYTVRFKKEKMNIAGAVEEADIELCASGFDNLLMDPDLEELRQYHQILLQIGAVQCAFVIAELLTWIDENSQVDPMDLIATDSARANELWRRYDSASVAENPRDLANSA